MRRLLVAISSLILAATAAHAECKGQAGNVIFEDTFADDSGGWAMSDGPKYEEVKNNALVLHPNGGGVKETNTTLVNANLTFAATEGDYCLEFVLPKPVAADNNGSAGVVFLRQDKNNQYLFEIGSDKSMYLSKLTNGTYTNVFSSTTAPVKLEPDAVNSVRVVIKDGKVTMYVNDQQIKVVRLQIPQGEMHFGIYTSMDKPSDANPEFLVKSFKVTAAQ